MRAQGWSDSLETLIVVLAALVALNLVGFPVRALFLRWRVPPAVSLMALGALVGPSALGFLPDAWLEQRAVLSKLAFVVLLLRAGLGLSPPGFPGSRRSPRSSACFRPWPSWARWRGSRASCSSSARTWPCWRAS